ncbi:hypothetical protein AN958_08813 [Leucoagaricus sp. SymC.cos]|nr:hypothetical protein AN958_08813 [Leucoagaricus sp. SymC.cos]
MSGTTTSPNTASPAHLSKRRRRRQVDAETLASDFFLTLGRRAVGFNQTRAEDDEKGYEAFNVNYPWFWQSIPSKQEVCLYSNLPVDLVRSIFEMAMWEPPPPCHLLLVSREIKSWVEPLLYLHIYIRDDKAMNLLYRTYRERWMPGRKSKSIPIDNSPLLKETQSIVICSQYAMHRDMLQEMTNLESLENWTTHAAIVHLLQRDSSTNRRIQEPPELDGPYLKKLRHLGFDGRLPQWEPTHTFAHQVFRDITHLDVYFFNHDRWMSIRHLQNLTHLCIDMVHNPDGFRSSDLSRIIEMIPVLPPSLIVFILGCIGERNRDYDLTDFKRNDNPEDIRLPNSSILGLWWHLRSGCLKTTLFDIVWCISRTGCFLGVILDGNMGRSYTAAGMLGWFGMMQKPF